MIEQPKLDLQWMCDHHPIFKKMQSDTAQRQASEAEYKKLKERVLHDAEKANTR